MTSHTSHLIAQCVHPSSRDLHDYEGHDGSVEVSWSQSTQHCKEKSPGAHSKDHGPESHQTTHPRYGPTLLLLFFHCVAYTKCVTEEVQSFVHREYLLAGSGCLAGYSIGTNSWFAAANYCKVETMDGRRPGPNELSSLRNVCCICYMFSLLCRPVRRLDRWLPKKPALESLL